MAHPFEVNPEDRRREPRVSLSRPCKIQEPVSGRYVAGTTCNVSPGGMLLRLDRSLPVEPGTRLLVGVAPHRRSAVISRSELLEGVVTRHLRSTTGETMIALRFAQREAHLPLRLVA